MDFWRLFCNKEFKKNYRKNNGKHYLSTEKIVTGL